MGQHKRNPVAISAKRGELPPKEPKKSKAEIDREMYYMCKAVMDCATAFPASEVKEMFSDAIRSKR